MSECFKKIRENSGNSSILMNGFVHLWKQQFKECSRKNSSLTIRLIRVRDKCRSQLFFARELSWNLESYKNKRISNKKHQQNLSNSSSSLMFQKDIGLKTTPSSGCFLNVNSDVLFNNVRMNHLEIPVTFCQVCESFLNLGHGSKQNHGKNHIWTLKP